MVAGVAGVGAILAAVGVGTAALITAPEPAPSTPVTAEHITVSTPPMVIPLSQDEILGLLDQSPDYGPTRRPVTARLMPDRPRLSGVHAGAGRAPGRDQRPPGVVLVVPGDTPHSLAVYAVALNCSAADTGLLANTQVPRP